MRSWIQILFIKEAMKFIHLSLLFILFHILFLPNIVYEPKFKKVSQINKEEIRENLDYFLDKYNRNWNEDLRDNCVNIIYEGSREFNIDYKIVLACISVESQFNIYAKGYNRDSIDFGLSQQNSRYIDQRYLAVEKYLRKAGIPFTSSKFDMAKNIYSCFLVFKDIEQNPIINSFPDSIKAYNVGVNGIKMKIYKRVAYHYYIRFYENYILI